SVLRSSASAALIGETTFGHSGRQELVKLSDGGRLQVTGAFFTGPDSEPIDEGFAPDVRIRGAYPDADDGEGDPGGAAESGEDAGQGEDGTEQEAAASGDSSEGNGPEEAGAEHEPEDPVLERGLRFLLDDEELEREVAA
ncbi:MAG: S41 family peptidase, partial [Holophagales bacterium]|nr:S41 family peptidase [Holophagales bacterium]